MKGIEYCVSSETGVFLNEDCDIRINNKECYGVTVYLMQ